MIWGNNVTYQLEERPDGGAWTEAFNGGATSAAIAGKSDGSYDYRVRACAGTNNCGPWSGELAVSVTGSAAPVVEAPPAPYNALPSLIAESEKDATDKAGTVAGAFRVTESGAASYAVPIYAVPGTAGVAPELALSYNSQAGNGVAGLGWVLEGASSIVRCRATRHQDGAAKPIQWNAEDKFCLDGQRLVLDSGTYGSPNSTYRTEIDTFAIVKAVGGTAGHPDHFEVRRKDGSVSHYGNTPGDSHTDAKRNNGGGQTLAWAIKRFADSVGNPVWYLYSGDADSHRLTEVRYGYGSSAGPNNHHAAIELVYEDRDDDISGYVAGHEFASRKRLRAIQTQNHHGAALAVVRELRLGYRNTASSDDKTSRLVSVTECTSDDSAAACREPTKFSWPANTPGFKKKASGKADLTRRKDRGVLAHHPADVNGDGAMDLVWVEWDADGANDTDHHLKYALSSGTALVPAGFGGGGSSIEYKENVSRTLQSVLARPIDYNGDGRADVAVWRVRDQVWRIHLSIPVATGGWRLSATPVATPITDRTTEFTDLNGDGLVDAVYGRGATIYARYLERRDPNKESTPIPPNQAYAFGNEAKLHTVSTTLPELDRLSALRSTGVWAGGYDFNGDGLADIVARTRFEVNLEQVGGRLSQTLHGPYVANPDGTWWRYANFREDDLYPADYNGDGLTDLIRVARSGNFLVPHLEINTGTGFKSHYTALLLDADKVDILPAIDHNGDGRLDFVYHDRRRELIVAHLFNPNTGVLNTSGRLVRRTDGSDKSARLFLDADGDGATDYLLLSDTASKGKLEIFPSNNAGRFPNQVANITNGLGAATKIAHESLSRTDHYERLDVQRAVSPAPPWFRQAQDAGCSNRCGNHHDLPPRLPVYRHAGGHGSGVAGPVRDRDSQTTPLGIDHHLEANGLPKHLGGNGEILRHGGAGRVSAPRGGNG